MDDGARKRNAKARGTMIKAGNELYTEENNPITISVDLLEDETDPNSKVTGHKDVIQISFLGTITSIF